jgi:hypothetical protein
MGRISCTTWPPKALPMRRHGLASPSRQGGKEGVNRKCEWLGNVKKIFASETFQERFKAQLAVLDRLYRVGVEVNRFQLEELR